MNLKPFFLYSIFAILLIGACNEPSLIGTDLIDEEQLSIRYKDDIPLKLSTIQGDSILTYRRGVLPNGNPCGVFQDPIFGTTTAEIYAELGLQFSNWDFTGLNVRKAPEFDLILPFNTDFCYGDFSGNYTLEIYKLMDDLDAESDYYSGTTDIAFEPEPIGRYSGPLNPFDDVIISDFSPLDSAGQLSYPHLRVPLTDSFKMDFIRRIAIDTLNVENDFRFQENVLRGLYMKATEATAGMPVFDLQSSRAGIRMAYDDDPNNDGIVTEGERREYVFGFSSTTFGSAKTTVNSVQHDYTASFAEPFIGNQNTKDTMLMQGTIGLLGEVEFPDLSDLAGVVVNQAVLEFTILDLPNDDPASYTAIDQILVLYEDEMTGERVIIDDYSSVSAFNLSVSDIIGGNIEEDPDGKKRYRMNISNHFQQMLKGDVPNKVRLQTVFPQVQRIGRMALGEAKFKLTYTEL